MPKLTIRQLMDSDKTASSLLFSYDYTDRTSMNYAKLSDVLERIDYRFVDENVMIEYNDIKGYYEVEIEKIQF